MDTLLSNAQRLEQYRHHMGIITTALPVLVDNRSMDKNKANEISGNLSRVAEILTAELYRASAEDLPREYEFRFDSMDWPRRGKHKKRTKSEQQSLYSRITIALAALQLLQGLVTSYQTDQKTARQDELIAAQTETITELQTSIEELTEVLKELKEECESNN